MAVVLLLLEMEFCGKMGANLKWVLSKKFSLASTTLQPATKSRLKINKCSSTNPNFAYLLLQTLQKVRIFGTHFYDLFPRYMRYMPGWQRSASFDRLYCPQFNRSIRFVWHNQLWLWVWIYRIIFYYQYLKFELRSYSW